MELTTQPVRVLNEGNSIYNESQLNPTHTAQLIQSVRVLPRPQIFALPRQMYTQVLRSSLFQGSPTRGLSPDFGRKRKEDVN